MRMVIKALLIFGLLISLFPAAGFAESSDDMWQKFRVKAMEYKFTPNRLEIEAHRPLWIEINNLGK
ncbi:MAG TPA: hypothetical protein VLB09_01020 [Nitrospiria bacterium]|nr:hypothetical protein [Nitrospiria bacterium]